MRKILTAPWLVILFLLIELTLPALADQEQKTGVSKSKAEMLEEKSAPEGSKKLPAPNELIARISFISTNVCTLYCD
ncbi:MAG: hypothetical protein WAU15_12890 [Nitrosomonas sp.]